MLGYLKEVSTRQFLLRRFEQPQQLVKLMDKEIHVFTILCPKCRFNTTCDYVSDAGPLVEPLKPLETFILVEIL